MKLYALFIESKPCDDEYEETHLDWAPTIFKSMNTVQQMSLLTTEYKRDLL